MASSCSRCWETLTRRGLSLRISQATPVGLGDSQLQQLRQLAATALAATMAATALVQRLNHGPVFTCADGPSFPRWRILLARVVDKHVLRVHEPSSKHTPFVPARLGPCLALEPQVHIGAQRSLCCHHCIRKMSAPALVLSSTRCRTAADRCPRGAIKLDTDG